MDKDGTGLAARLREATSTEHRATETRSFISELMGGELDLDAYVDYLAQFAYVYRALESRTPQPNDPPFINDDRLRRFQAIVSDLEHLGAEDWESSHPALEPTLQYARHISGLDADDVPRYVAHHYTRYLGDLSGGQAIAKRVARHYGAKADQLSFYRFVAINRPGAFKAAYRESLDNLALSSSEEATLIDEAKRAFVLNAAIFDALGAHRVLTGP